MAMADFLKGLATVEDDAVHGIVGAFLSADAYAHHAFGKNPLYFDADRVRRITSTLQTYFGIEPLGKERPNPAPQKVDPAPQPAPQPQDQQQDDNAAGAKTQADLGGDAGAGAGGGPAPATERPAGIVSTIETDVASLTHKALDIGEEGMQAIAETLGRTAEPARPAAPSIARS